PDLVEDERFATAAARDEHRQQLESLLTPVFATKTAIVWSRVLDDHGVPNEFARDMKAGEGVLFDADNERLGLVAEYVQAKSGRLRQLGSLIDFSDTPGRINGAPPMCGEHTREVLSWLGYDDAAMQSLKDERVVYWPDDNYFWTV